MSEASQTVSFRAPRELSLVMRASRRPPLSERPIILLWSAAALLAGAVVVRVTRGSGPVRVGAIEVPVSAPVRVKVPGEDAHAAPAAPAETAPTPQPSAAKADQPATPAIADQPTAPPSETPAPPEEGSAQAGEPHGETLTAAQAGKGFRGRNDVDYKAKARELFQAGKYREAAENYAHATHRTPTDPAAFAGLGASWLAAGEPNRAIVAYQRAVQLKPDVSGFQAALGRAYATKGDRGRAAAAYSKALSLDPNNQAAKTGLDSVKR